MVILRVPRDEAGYLEISGPTGTIRLRRADLPPIGQADTLRGPDGAVIGIVTRRSPRSAGFTFSRAWTARRRKECAA